jgi:hypothetical protein
MSPVVKEFDQASRAAARGTRRRSQVRERAEASGAVLGRILLRREALLFRGVV